MNSERAQAPAHDQSPPPSAVKVQSRAGLCVETWIFAGVSLVLLATFATYAAALHFHFVYDDFTIIVYNERVHSSRFLAQYFTQQVWGNDAGAAANLYRPLFLTWLFLNYKMFGLSPAGWHFTNILLHILATWLVFLLSRKLLGRRNSYAALIAAALFGLHPVHVEAVAWVSAVTELLSACFFLGSFLCFLQAGSGKRLVWVPFSLLLFVGALGSKETAILLPVALLCYLLLLPEDQEAMWDKGRLISISVRLIPYILVSAGYLGVRYAVLHGMAHSLSDQPLWSSALLIPWALQFYIGQWLLPVGLAPFYDLDRNHALSAPLLLLSLAVLCGLAVCIFYWARKVKSNVPVFLGAWFVLTLAPALAILLLMSRYEGVHDRYLYLPSVALAILSGSLWSLLFAPHAGSKRISQQVVCAVVLVAALGLASRQQGEYWQNDLALFTRACAVAPQNAMARLNLAAELLRRGRFQESLAESQAVIRQDSHLGIAYSLAAEASFLQGDYAKAESNYLQSLKMSAPEPKQLFYLGMSEIKMRKYSDGLSVLQKAVTLWPEAPLLHYAMGMAFAGMGNWPGAREQYQLELQFHPQTPGLKATLLDAEQHLTPATQIFPSQSKPPLGTR